MTEDRYEVWSRTGDGWSERLASEMTLESALLFVWAWLTKFYNEDAGLEIRPMVREREAE